VFPFISQKVGHSGLVMVRNTASSHDVRPHQVWWSCIKQHKNILWKWFFYYFTKCRSQWPSYSTRHCTVQWCITTPTLVILQQIAYYILFGKIFSF